ncbi:MAG: type II toxin-antitoxin system Phd/YefM family antitoxin [Thermoanaerobaculaceae bacterium]
MTMFRTHYRTMKSTNIHEAKTQLSGLLAAAERGEVVVICRRNRPVAELRAVGRRRSQRRPIGLAKGRLQVPAAFFEPLPDDLAAAFEGRP